MEDIELYLKKYNFEKQLKALKKELKGKKIIVYGTGALFQTVLKNYDLSGLDIIGVSDRKYQVEDDGKYELNYRVIRREDIVKYNPDCILIAIKMFLPILNNFSKEFIDTELLPLVDKPFWTLLKEI